MSSRCGCKEVHVYRFPIIITYAYILLLYLLFFAAAFLFCSFFNVFRSCSSTFL